MDPPQGNCSGDDDVDDVDDVDAICLTLPRTHLLTHLHVPPSDTPFMSPLLSQ